MSEQIKKLRDNNTWITVQKPKKPTQILPGKWVYDLKTDNNDNILEFRARWVVCGNFQRKTTENPWSPVVNDISLKLFLIYCAKYNYVLAQADIVAAFLNALYYIKELSMSCNLHVFSKIRPLFASFKRLYTVFGNLPYCGIIQLTTLSDS